MPANTRSRQNKAELIRYSPPNPVPDEQNNNPGGTPPNVPQQVIDSFRALQAVVSTEHENCEQYFHQRSIIIHDIPELPTNTLPSERQSYVEARVSETFDVLGVEAKPLAVFRMGRPSEARPRLAKVILPSRSQYFAILGRVKSLSQTNGYNHLFIRASLTEAERKREFDLRKEALDRNQSSGRKEYVVYRGVVVKVSEIPNLRQAQVRTKRN
ncbi:hypothetical protein Y032_0015g2556 [Ancylostoma ceylanicum]|uniref:Uncharacterized protein n=1 Tax=Ancylostoma ceylanicum TaxID=53326 RepID=A0A016V950_9BILA|nr:hypothetical protein Y032_0015g2556 [Ancylostoma ceylanicum]